MKKIITLILSISMMFAFDINSPENQEKIEYYRNILSENDFNKLISSMSSENLKAEKTEYNKKIQEIKNKQKQARRNNQNTNSSSNRDQFVEFQLDLYDRYGDTWNGSTNITLNSGNLNIEIHIDWDETGPYLDIYSFGDWLQDNSLEGNCDGNDTHKECVILLPAAMSDPSISYFYDATIESSGYYKEERGFTFSYQDQLLFGAVADMGFPSESGIPFIDDWFGSEYAHVDYSYLNGYMFEGYTELYLTGQYFELFNAEDCAGIQNGPNQVDECGVCDDNPTNDNSTCLDECGIPNGDNSSCADCQGTPNGDAWVSDCGCVAADNSGDDCDDQCGVPNGDNSTCTDECGVINGNSNPLDCNNDGIDDVCEETYDTGFYDGAQSGDINQDGMTNVVDIILYVNVVLGN